MGNMRHPKSANTPFDKNLYVNACETCHMPKATATGFPMHVWRVNTDAAYSSFPTKAEFYGGSCSVNATNAASLSSAGCTTTTNGGGGVWTGVTKKTIGVTDASVTDYAGAVSVDVDLACGQCHGGATGTVRAGAFYISKANLANFAKAIHDGGTPPPPPALNTAPTSAGTTTVAGWVVTLVDSSSDTETAQADLKVFVNWGDGKAGVISAGSTTTHTYTRARLYTIVQTVTDKGDSAGQNVKINTKKYAPMFVPTRVNVGGTATTGTSVTLKKNGHTVKYVKAAGGAYNFSNVLPGTYSIRAYLKSTGTTTTAPFAVDATDVTVALP
jgi:mono/diheme cytochrome c family protein